eukprot:jgi/Orpsp1_1/1181817/evm.model.c7180000078748.1
MTLLKKNLLLAIASIFFLNNKALADDCTTFNSAVQSLGFSFKSNYKVDNCCDFSGIKCNSNKEITEIKINNVNGIEAKFSNVADNLSNLKSLTSLDLSGNNFYGKFPNSLCKLTSLKNLNLSNNKLSGTIPYECKDLQNLESFNLQGNTDLTGYVPILSKVKKCAYKSTKLCNLPTAECRAAPNNCTLDDVKKTNAENGNPDPKSKTYEGAPTDRALSYDDYYNYGSNGYGYGSGYDNYGYVVVLVLLKLLVVVVSSFSLLF